jgi:hypothetical protein
MKALRSEFRSKSDHWIYDEYDGSFVSPNSLKWNEVRVVRLRFCHRCLGVLEGEIQAFDEGTREGVILVGGREFPFCLVREEEAALFVECVGKPARFNFSPSINDLRAIYKDPLMSLPSLRLRNIRKSDSPETNYLEIMGKIHSQEEGGFVVVSFDYMIGEVCYTPFIGSYPFPDEMGEFVWLKGTFVPETGQISLLESSSITFVESKHTQELRGMLKKFLMKKRALRSKKKKKSKALEK